MTHFPVIWLIREHTIYKNNGGKKYISDCMKVYTEQTANLNMKQTHIYLNKDIKSNEEKKTTTTTLYLQTINYRIKLKFRIK